MINVPDNEFTDTPEPIDRLARPFQVFAQNKVSGAVLLMAGMVAAIVWANSPWASSYTATLHSHISIEAFGVGIDKSLHHWINDGLMAIFFFVVGMEIKREVLAGELATLRKAMLPISGAIGGMLVPALVYTLINRGGSGAHGWGIPMATDIAFALGVLLVLGPRVPLALKVFLTALAIVDDIGAIVVIAVFYTNEFVLSSLIIGGFFVLVSVCMNLLGVRNSIAYFIVGTIVWFAFLKSGVHATLASVLMALTIPAKTRIDGTQLIPRLDALVQRLKHAGFRNDRGLLSAEQQHDLHEIERTVERSTAPLQQLEHALLPLVTFFVLPVFALANAGLELRGDVAGALQSPVALGIIAGLIVGKQIGIFGFAWLAVRLNIAQLPTGVSWRQVHAVAILGGIGFTMSLFVGGLAFAEPQNLEQARLGILVASTIAAIWGWLALRRAPEQGDIQEAPDTPDG